MADPNWKINLDAWKARQTQETTQFKSPRFQGQITDYTDLVGQLSREIIETKFPDYLYPGPGRKVVAESPPSGAIADYAPFTGVLRPPKAQNAYQREYSGESAETLRGATTDEVINNAFVMLHELTHARSPFTNKFANAGAPSESAVKDLVQAAIKLDKFPSQGESGNLEELVASLLPIRDMNARGITPTRGLAGEAQQGYNELKKQFAWLPEYLDTQSKPEQKFYSKSPQIKPIQPSLGEAVTGALKSLFGVQSKTPDTAEK